MITTEGLGLPRTEYADIEVLEDGTLYSTKFEDVYHSREGHTEESEHIFLQGNELQQRWGSERRVSPFVIGELGFGTGLNFFLTWKLFAVYRVFALKDSISLCGKTESNKIFTMNCHIDLLLSFIVFSY